MLMDRLLKKENFDLKLTPYRVLATGRDHGNKAINDFFFKSWLITILVFMNDRHSSIYFFKISCFHTL
jgi:hypothetical protein